MRILFVTMSLAVILSLPAYGGTGHDHSPAAKEKMAGLSHLKDSFAEKVDGYDVTIDIMTNQNYHKIMKAMGMNHANAGGSTHRIAVTLKKDGKGVEDAAFDLKTLTPENKEVDSQLHYNTDGMNQYANDLKLSKMGRYRFVVLFNAGGKSHKAEINYEVK